MRFRRGLRAAILVVGLVLSLMTLLPVIPKANAAYAYTFEGAYNEAGFRDGAINCTLFQYGASPATFELDGSNVTTVSSAVENILKFDVGAAGANETRVVYLLAENETVYVFRPSQPYYTYSFSVSDFLGVEDGYLESIINVNGTDYVVERWSISIAVAGTPLPFTMTWGHAYKMRLRCNLGVFYYGTWTAGATMEATFAITSDMFPEIPTDLRNIITYGVRINSTYGKAAYSDANSSTTWIWMGVAELGNATMWQETNVTASILVWNVYGLDAVQDYYIRIIALHQVRGELVYTYILPIVQETENPFAGLTTILGSSPFDMAQLIPVCLILLVFGSFSYYNAGVGLVVTVILAAFLWYIGWFSISSAWLAGSFAIAILAAIALGKERYRE